MTSTISLSFLSLDLSTACFSKVMDLPFEIWQHIASFIPPNQLRRLYAVNRVFYEIVMVEKYRVFDFCKGAGTVIGALACLKRSSNAQRVRTLNLYPDVLADHIVWKPAPGRRCKVVSLPTRLCRHTGIPITERDRWSQQTRTEVLHLMSSMSNVVNLNLKITTYSQFSPQSQFRDELVIAGWTAFGSTLRNLTLVIPDCECNFPLNPTLVFMALEHLAIELLPSNSLSFNSVNATKLVRDLLVPFINNHHPTLKSLELSFDHSNGSTWFSGICHLQSLTKFTFRCQYPWPGPGIDISSLEHILTKHSGTLRELSISLWYCHRPTMDQWHTQPSLEVALPRLEFLHVTLEYFSDSFLTASYLGQFKNSLTSLKLTGRRLTLRDLESIVEAFAGRDKLRVLYLEVDILGAALFDLLSMKLLSLDNLHLVFFWVTAEFYRTMKLQSYSEWKLRHFTAQSYLRIEPNMLADWQSVIGAALPHLHTLRIAHYA